MPFANPFMMFGPFAMWWTWPLAAAMAAAVSMATTIMSTYGITPFPVPA